jgi:hypothetical protein
MEPTVRMIASVGVVAPAVSKDQRRLAQQLMRLHVSFPDPCNELSESMGETVSAVSGCVTDSSKAGPGRRLADLIRYAVHREGGARFAILRFALTGSGVTETSGTGSFSRAKASRGGLVTGATATTGGFCGTMVGALVSKTIGSGHLRSDFILIIGLSACSLVALRVGSIGSNQFAMNNIAKSRLPTKAM